MNEEGATHSVHLSCSASSHRSHTTDIQPTDATAKTNDDETKPVL